MAPAAGDQREQDFRDHEKAREVYWRERRRLENQAPAGFAVDEEHLRSMLATVPEGNKARRLWIKLAVKGLAREGRDAAAIADLMPGEAEHVPRLLEEGLFENAARAELEERRAAIPPAPAPLGPR